MLLRNFGFSGWGANATHFLRLPANVACNAMGRVQGSLHGVVWRWRPGVGMGSVPLSWGQVVALRGVWHVRRCNDDVLHGTLSLGQKGTKQANMGSIR